MQFIEQYRAFLDTFGEARIMVLSTSKNNHVTSRMMSIIHIDEAFYFQTDKNFRKYEQLKSNPNVALCIENIQIEGICEEIGRPTEYPAFCEQYQKHFANSYRRYTPLENERLFKITPQFIERWLYLEGIPFMETFDIEQQEYRLMQYEGV